MSINRKLHMILISLVIIGALNWGLVGAVKFNLVEKIFGSYSNFIYIVVGIAAILLITDRNVYLPFLGEAVYPCALLKDKVPANADVEVLVKVPPFAKVVYWAAEPENEELDDLPNPMVAYHNYENSGVVTADKRGLAVLKVRDPTQYNVYGDMVTLEKHVHYRYCTKKEPGMLSEIYTEYIEQQ